MEAIKVPSHAVIYRANQFWNQLSETILHSASVYNESYMSERGFTLDRLKKGALLKVVQVFPENTSEAEISQWLNENETSLFGVKQISCDQTVRSLMENKWPGKYQYNVIDFARNSVAEELVGQREVADVYHELLKGIFDAYKIKRVQLVKQSLSDYNPLKLKGCDREGRKDIYEKYIAAFTALIPEGIKVEVITDPMQLSMPDDQTVVIVHHHAIGEHKDSQALKDCPRVLMPYLSGLVNKAFKAFDASSLIPDTFVEETRKSLEKSYSEAVE